MDTGNPSLLAVEREHTGPTIATSGGDSLCRGRLSKPHPSRAPPHFNALPLYHARLGMRHDRVHKRVREPIAL